MAWAAASLVGGLASGRPGALVGVAVVGAAAALGKVAASGLVARGGISLARHLGEELRDRVLGALLAGQRRQGADDVFRILEALRGVEQAALVGGLGGLRALVTLLPLLGLVLVTVPGLFWIELLVLLPFALALAMLRRSVRKDEQRAMELTATLDHQTDTVFRHADLWRVAGTGSRTRGWIQTLSRQSREALVGARVRRAMLSASNEALAALGVLGLVLAASTGRLAQGGPLASFAALALLAYRPLRDWGDARGAWVVGQSALALLAPWLADAPPPATPPPGPWPLSTLQAEQFGAAWHGARWTFTVAPGSLVLVVGPNGSGKTTLLRALLGLEPSRGGLRYGETSLDHRGVGPSWRPFAWCPQDAPLLGASLEDNLALGGAAASAEALAFLGEPWEALRGARLGEGGRALSGGERAWVNLARACGSGMPVLLLDEPTASLDAAAEARVVAALEALRGRRTLLLVTHRPELWKNPDQILTPPPDWGS